MCSILNEILRAAIERAEGQRKPRELRRPRQSRQGPRESTKKQR
jgi:hypothetical protein